MYPGREAVGLGLLDTLAMHRPPCSQDGCSFRKLVLHLNCKKITRRTGFASKCRRKQRQSSTKNRGETKLQDHRLTMSSPLLLPKRGELFWYADYILYYHEDGKLTQTLFPIRFYLSAMDCRSSQFLSWRQWVLRSPPSLEMPALRTGLLPAGSRPSQSALPSGQLVGEHHEWQESGTDNSDENNSGANTDMLGRRWFLIAGQVICFVGHMVISRASSGDMIIAGMAVGGFGAALCQMAAFALPELLPNKWRHIGTGHFEMVLCA